VHVGETRQRRGAEIAVSGIDDELFSFGLKSHFDFVITESDDIPIFAVEFDGPGHGSLAARRRDQLKNRLCDHFEFPVLRVNRNYLSPTFSNWDLLSWFCTVWFVKRDWDEAVHDGKIAIEDSIFEDANNDNSDALDFDGIYDAIRNAGLELPARPRADDLKGRVVNCFLKCEADRRGTLRGRRQIMLDDSDVHHHRHSKAAVGGVAALAIGDPAVFVSVDAMHQGPQGGGPVIAIIDAGE